MPTTSLDQLRNLQHSSKYSQIRVVFCEKLNRWYIQLEDKNTGQLFAESPITEFPTKSIEPVSDSSRYFVLKIENQGELKFQLTENYLNWQKIIWDVY